MTCSEQVKRFVKALDNGACEQLPDSRLYGMQVFRALGCIGIVIAHTAAYAEMNDSEMVVGQTLNYWGRYGMLAFVSFFFAMSGFFTASDIVNQKNTPVLFLKKRFSRIYPTYWVAVAGAVLLTLCVTYSFSSTNQFYQIFLLLPGATVPYVLNVEWTLFYEIVFYLLCTSFFLKKGKRYYPVFLAAWSCAIMIGSTVMELGSAPAFVFPQLLFSRQNFAFIAGSIAYYIYRFRPVPFIAPQYGIPLISVCLFTFVANYEYFYNQIIIGELFHYAVLIPLCLLFARLKINQKNVLISVGNCSYGIYLIHPTILNLTFVLFYRHGSTFHMLLCFAAVVTALVIGFEFGRLDQLIGRTARRFLLKNWNLNRCVRIATPIIIILLVFGMVGAVNEMISHQMDSFDFTRVLDQTDYIAGWVDDWSAECDTNGQVFIEANGWGYDPVAIRPVHQVLIVSNGKVLPSTVTWHSRDGIEHLLGNPNIDMCGFHITVADVPTTELGDSADVYVVLHNGQYLELQHTQPLLVPIKS